MANTTADKLARLEETKETLTAKLIEKGLDVPDNTTFLERANLVGEIQSGSVEIETVVLSVTGAIVFSDFDICTVDSNNICPFTIRETGNYICAKGSCVLLYTNFLPRITGDCEYLGLDDIRRKYKINSDATFYFIAPP